METGVPVSEREEAIALLLAAPWWSLALKVGQACVLVSDIFKERMTVLRSI